MIIVDKFRESCYSLTIIFKNMREWILLDIMFTGPCGINEPLPCIYGIRPLAPLLLLIPMT